MVLLARDPSSLEAGVPRGAAVLGAARLPLTFAVRQGADRDDNDGAGLHREQL